MSIPDFQSTMLPLLKFTADRKDHSLREALDALAAQYGPTDEERKQMLPSGQQAVFDNRVAWARSYLKKAGLLSFPRRGLFKITERGLSVLEEMPAKINIRFLTRFPEFNEFRQKKEDEEEETADTIQERTPREQIESGYQKIKKDLQIELLNLIKSCSPGFFENLVVDLLVRMGYGGSRLDAGQAIGRSGDEGIDGIIKEDRLGLDIVYVQAKRWEGRRKLETDCSPLVFLSSTGNKLKRQSAAAAMHEYTRAAGLPSWVTPHSLRHAAATHMLQGGADWPTSRRCWVMHGRNRHASTHSCAPKI